MLLRTGSKEESVLKLSDKILHHFDGLRMLKDATLEELVSIHGVGIAKATQLIAAFELGRRMVRLEYQNRYSIRSPEDCATYMMEEMRFLQQEHFVCLYLNTKNQVIHRQTIFIGSLNSSIVHQGKFLKKRFAVQQPLSYVFITIGLCVSSTLNLPYDIMVIPKKLGIT